MGIHLEQYPYVVLGYLTKKDKKKIDQRLRSTFVIRELQVKCLPMSESFANMKENIGRIYCYFTGFSFCSIAWKIYRKIYHKVLQLFSTPLLNYQKEK